MRTVQSIVVLTLILVLVAASSVAAASEPAAPTASEPAEPTASEPAGPTASEPAELKPTGAERVLPRSSLPFTLVQDGQGDVWALGDGLMRFSEADGTLDLTGDWSIADDAAFATWLVAPARDGGVWLGGSTIRRFDGTRFTDVIEGPGGDLRELVEAPDGALWAVVGDGYQPHAAVWRWDGTSWTDMQAGRALGGLGIDDQGRAWVLTGTFRGPILKGVSVFDGMSWRTYGADDHPRLAGGDYGSLQVTPGGEVFVGTPEALLAFDGSKWKRLPDDAISGDRMISVAPDGTPWVITMQAVFTRPPGGSFEPVTGPPGGWLDISSVTALRDGALVADGHGFHRIRDGAVTTVWSPPPAPLADPYGPRVVATDTELWISDWQGMWRCPVPAVDGDCSLMEDGLSMPPAEEQASIAQAPDGTLWTTGSRGTARFDEERWVVIDDAPGQRLAVAPDGTIWVLEADGGGLTAWREEGSEWVAEHHAVPDWLAFVEWMDVLPDGTVMTYQGESFPILGRFDGASWTKQLFKSIAGRPIEWLYAPDVDADGHVWILWSGPMPDGGGEPAFSTARLDGTDWTVFDVPAGWAHGLVAGPDGSVWLGGDDGLFRFDGHAWVPAGFQGLYVVPMGATTDGAVWFTDGSGAMYRMPAP